MKVVIGKFTTIIAKFTILAITTIKITIVEVVVLVTINGAIKQMCFIRIKD